MTSKLATEAPDARQVIYLETTEKKTSTSGTPDKERGEFLIQEMSFQI